MSRDSRDDLIDAYFRALDENDPSIVRPAIAETFVYESRAGTLEGFEGLSDYITEYRSLTDSDHGITRRIHGDEATVVEGTVSGLDENDDPAEAKFCDVFEFDDGDDHLAQVTVYVNDA